MFIATRALIVLIAVLHFYFLILEMFLWTKPAGLKAFRQTIERANATATLAKNQGLYNGFLAAGLVWGLILFEGALFQQVETFFLSCVLVAGIFGALTVSRKIFIIQGLPAAVALVLLVMQ